MYEQAEPVRYPFPRPDSGQTSGPPPQPPPVQQGGSRGRVRHGNDDPDKVPEEPEASSHTCEEAEAVKRYAAYTSAERTYPGGASGRCTHCSSIRSRLGYTPAGIVVLLSLVAVGFAPVTLVNKEKIFQLSTTVDALKRDQDNMCTAVDYLKRGLDKERNRTAALDQRLNEMIKTPPTPGVKARLGPYSFKLKLPRSTNCDTYGLTALGPRTKLASYPVLSGSQGTLYMKSVSDKKPFWFGLHDRREEGSFEWLDGSATPGIRDNRTTCGTGKIAFCTPNTGKTSGPTTYATRRRASYARLFQFADCAHFSLDHLGSHIGEIVVCDILNKSCNLEPDLLSIRVVPAKVSAMATELLTSNEKSTYKEAEVVKRYVSPQCGSAAACFTCYTCWLSLL
uniref:C-type lectin domain-containing protein n=1 Tax=Branchiostoma floridae TaxID=7739 RepID=C3YGQ6_BRAFL|eukprot:XP_002604555.1 hypothetical protein BRAFLDRAFT_79417 [Branchiostoma floridae]